MLNGKPVRVWGVQVWATSLPQAGEVVHVRAENGTNWTTTVSMVQSYNPKTGRAVLITPSKKDNNLSSEE